MLLTANKLKKCIIGIHIHAKLIMIFFFVFYEGDLYLTGINDGLQLQSRQQATGNGCFGDRQSVCDIRWRDA